MMPCHFIPCCRLLFSSTRRYEKRYCHGVPSIAVVGRSTAGWGGGHCPSFAKKGAFTMCSFSPQPCLHPTDVVRLGARTWICRDRLQLPCFNHKCPPTPEFGTCAPDEFTDDSLSCARPWEKLFESHVRSLALARSQSHMRGHVLPCCLPIWTLSALPTDFSAHARSPSSQGSITSKRLPEIKNPRQESRRARGQ